MEQTQKTVYHHEIGLEGSGRELCELLNEEAGRVFGILDPLVSEGLSKDQIKHGTTFAGLNGYAAVGSYKTQTKPVILSGSEILSVQFNERHPSYIEIKTTELSEEQIREFLQ